MTPDTCI